MAKKAKRLDNVWTKNWKCSMRSRRDYTRQNLLPKETVRGLRWRVCTNVLISGSSNESQTSKLKYQFLQGEKERDAHYSLVVVSPMRVAFVYRRINDRCEDFLQEIRLLLGISANNLKKINLKKVRQDALYTDAGRDCECYMRNCIKKSLAIRIQSN